MPSTQRKSVARLRRYSQRELTSIRTRRAKLPVCVFCELPIASQVERSALHKLKRIDHRRWQQLRSSRCACDEQL